MDATRSGQLDVSMLDQSGEIDLVKVHLSSAILQLDYYKAKALAQDFKPVDGEFPDFIKMILGCPDAMSFGHLVLDEMFKDSFREYMQECV